MQYILVTILFVLPTVASGQVPEADEPQASPSGDTEAVGTAGAEPTDAREFKPRYELYVPSAAHLFRRAGESHGGSLAAHLSGLFTAKVAGGGGLTVEEWRSLGDTIRSWPDTSVGMATYAPTAAGEARWVIRLDWPVEALVGRISDILELEAAEEMLEGVSVKPGAEGEYRLTLGGDTLAVMLADSQGGSLILSDADVEQPDTLYGQGHEKQDTQKKSGTLVYSRFNLTGTEKDSGALFGAQVPWLQDIRYQASVRSSGQWSERVGVTWNALVGTGVKAAVRHAKRGVYVPREAFGAVLVSSPLLLGMPDVMAGLPPGTLAGQMGGLAGERYGPEMCFVVLPGTGILPFPDFVIQTRARYTSAILEDVRRAVTKANQLRAKDDLPETWHEIEVNGRTVFYNDGREHLAGGIQPVVYRKVIFADERTDPKGRSRSFLNVGFTSTDVEALVRRWTAAQSADERVALAADKKADGRGWLNWERLYGHLYPWLNLGIAGVDPTAVLPSTETVAEHLPDATVTVDAKFTGMIIKHVGPVPLGALYLPLTLAGTLAPDESGSTDVSRERIARDRLTLLHKNALLFKKDVGRWPARVAELDGYIDFEAHPWILHLRQSTRSAWRQGLRDMLGIDGEENDDAEEDEEYDIDDSIYVIDWDGSRWTLGIKPGILEHLAELYVDQDGEIHRVAKAASDETAAEDASAKTTQAM